MLGRVIDETLRLYREYAKRMRDVLLFRTTWFEAYDVRDGKVFVEASRFIYTIGSAVLTISAVLYFAFNTSRPEFYELLPISFLATMGLACFIVLSVSRAYRITFVEFFVCFAYVMGTFCTIWLLGRLVRNAIALYPHDVPIPGDTAAIPPTLRDICRNPDSSGCKTFTQTTSTRELVDTVDYLLKYWELLLAIYFGAALAFILSKRARGQTIRIFLAILVGLGAYVFVDRGTGYAAQIMLDQYDCRAKREFAQFAIKECGEFINSRLHTLRFYAHYRKALAFENQMDRTQSVSEYINAIRYDPNFTLEPELIDRLSVLARGYATQGHSADGLILLSAAVQRRPWDAQLLTLRGTIHMEAGNLDTAISDFTDATNRNPRFSEAHYNLGSAMETRKDWDAALNSHQEAFRLQPQERRYLRGIGRVHSLRGDHAAAMTELKKAAILDPLDSKTYYEQAQAYQRHNDLIRAKENYLKSIQLDKKNADAHRALALLYKDLKEYAASGKSCDEAISLYDDILKANENSLSALIGRGTCLFNNEHDERALSDYSTAIRINPREPTYQIARGDVYAEMDMQEPAIADFSAAADLDRRSAAAYGKRGSVRARKREYDLSLEDLGAAIDLDPRRAEYYRDRGLVYHALRNYPKALEDYDKALALKPGEAAVLARRCALRALVEKDKSATDSEIAKSIVMDCDQANQIGDRYPSRISHYRGIALWNLGLKQEAEAAYAVAYQEALRSLRENAAEECEQIVEKGQGLEGKARQKRAEALGRLSWYALFARNFPCALRAANRAIKLAPSVLWPKSNRAHARMFLGDHEVAKGIYLERLGEIIPGSGPWEKLFLEEFQIFRESGLDDPLIFQVENEFRLGN